MSTISRQTSAGIIYSYLGLTIGFVNLLVLQTKLLSTEQIGLLTFLITQSQTLSMLSLLGFNGTGFFFPLLREDKTQRMSYLLLACLVAGTGFIFFSSLVYAFQNKVFEFPSQSVLLKKFFLYVYPLTFFTLFFNVFELYKQLNYDIASPRIYRELYKRVFTLFVNLLLLFKSFRFSNFMLLWLLANILPTFQLIYSVLKSEWPLPKTFSFYKGLKGMLSTSFFAFLAGTAPLLSQTILLYVVTRNFGLSNAGIYGVALTIVNILILPNRSLSSIAYPVIVDAWKNKKLTTLRNIYTKSSHTLFLIAALFFTLIWANITTIIKMLGHSYAVGQQTILFLVLGYVINSFGGVNGAIIIGSRYYKFDSLLQAALSLLMIPFYNLSGILWGLKGPAITVCINYVLLNICRYFFIGLCFKIWPYSRQTLLLILLLISVFTVISLIPTYSNPFINSVIRSTIILFCYSLILSNLSIISDLRHVIFQTPARIKALLTNIFSTD